jgi:23S rRNA (guanosine2251-2'-O)-methyltransferase
MRKQSHKAAAPSKYPRLWGQHAVLAALDNPNRTIKRVWGTREALAKLDLPKSLPVQFAEAPDLARLASADSPHQGLVIEVEPLPDIALVDILEPKEIRPLVILDQVTDPHNVGAILRSAAAFNALAIVTQDRHAPPESGALARAASGTLEVVPWVRVVNLARALEEVAEAGYWRIGLDGKANTVLEAALTAAPTALVLGAEGAGLRHNTLAHCDLAARLPISPRAESLNVSNAAAVALYAVQAFKG